MARGYSESRHEAGDHGYTPSRPMRRAESQRVYGDKPAAGQYDELKARGFTAHYAESPVIESGDQQPRTLPRHRGQTRSRASTLTRPRSEAARSGSRASRPAAGAKSQVTRSRSWGARPAGVVVYNRHGEPVETAQPGTLQTPSKPPSTIGVGYRPNTALSGKSVRSSGTNMTAASGLSTVKSKNTMKAGLAVETMSAPNPFCPNTKGVCCLMVLTNLSIILICIGFIIVLQLTDPPVVWNIGIVILVAGIASLFVTLIYCMCICQETSTNRAGQPPPGELYWTHHWQKNFTIPELSTKQSVERWEDEDRFPEDNVSDTSSRDYPRLYLESDYGQRTDRENDLDTDLERAERERERRGNRYDRDESPQRY